MIKSSDNLAVDIRGVQKTNIVSPEGEMNLFPDNRPDGPVSYMFRSAVEFSDRLHRDQGGDGS